MGAEAAAEVAFVVGVVAFVEGVAEVVLQEVVVVVALGVEEDSRLALCNIIVLSIFDFYCRFEKRLYCILVGIEVLGIESTT